MRIEGNRKNHELSRKLGCEITHGCAKEAMFCYFCRRSKKTTPFASVKGVQILEPQLCKDRCCKEHEDAVNEEATRDTFSNT